VWRAAIGACSGRRSPIQRPAVADSSSASHCCTSGSMGRSGAAFFCQAHSPGSSCRARRSLASAVSADGVEGLSADPKAALEERAVVRSRAPSSDIASAAAVAASGCCAGGGWARWREQEKVRDRRCSRRGCRNRCAGFDQRYRRRRRQRRALARGGVGGRIGGRGRCCHRRGWPRLVLRRVRCPTTLGALRARPLRCVSGEGG
jgi:hypothetical protein